MKKNLTWTIIKKEFARFFGDKTLVFTAVIMPGLLIYLIYSLMGKSMAEMMSTTDEQTIVYVENMPATLAPMFDTLPGMVVVEVGFFRDEVIEALADKDVNKMLVSFPAGLDSVLTCPPSLMAVGDTALAPNIQIRYNSVNNNVKTSYDIITSLLDSYEGSRMPNLYDINRQDTPEETFDQASDSDELGSVLARLLPMLIVMLIFSGCMAVAPSAIAGEKERGTIATLLVTPMKRSQLALGKIMSLSSFALLSGISSFLGIIFSLPKLLEGEALGEVTVTTFYGISDYLLLLFLILATTLVMVSFVSILSALAKDVKAASTLITPFMLVVVILGLLPMLKGDSEVALGCYFIPIYNTIECIGSVFGFEVQTLPMIITICSNVVYTGLAVWALTKLFDSEKVMFGR